MDAEVLARLEEMKARLDAGEDIDTSEFWGIVGGIKRGEVDSNEVVALVGEVDGLLFKRSSVLKLSMAAGNYLSILALVAGLLLVAGGASGLVPLAGFALLVGQLVVGTAVHPLAHQLVGSRFGIEFSYFFLNGPAKVEPTVKTDYATYLSSDPDGRAWMHLSGAVATNAAMALALMAGWLGGAPNWALFAMLLVLMLLGGNEFVPMLLRRFGNPRPFGIRMDRSDVYRFLREREFSESGADL